MTLLTISAGVTRILHVDDQSEFGKLVKDFLEREDETFEVFTETTVDEGIDRLQKSDIDCVVSDYEMPDRDGLAFLDTVQESFSETPFILFTGKGSEQIASEAISSGVTDYLQKSGGTETYEVLANRIRNSVEKQQTERELERNRTFLNRVLNLSPAAILVLDKEGTITRANKRAESTLGISESELMGRSFDDAGEVVDTDGNPLSDDLLPFERVVETRNPVSNAERSIRRPDGNRLRLSINLAPFWSESGDLQHVIAVLSNVTEKDREKRHLQATINQLESFGNVLSHDLGNILQIAQGRLQLAAQTGEDEHISEVETSLSRAEDMLDELTTAMQAGSVVDTVAPVDLESVFGKAWETQATAEATKEVENGIKIMADELALQRMFENLIRNTFEHGVDTATVRVGSLINGFYVEDDGPGIPNKEREKVFEPEYTTKEDGTGTGLVSIHQIALAHGWETTITDGSDGGARFNFSNVDYPSTT